jgi:DNA-binding IclR family transcriptional regulator
MGIALESNKAKIAKRVIEVLEFFDDENREATVMDFVRRYNRPQSSTSELLASLVDLGLLYKDACTRSYTLTPRAAMLGSHFQPDLVRDGRLTTLVDRLVAQTGLGVAVFGSIGLNAQIFSWRTGARPLRTAGPKGFCGGLKENLSDSAVGLLFLSTIAQPRRDGVVRRLNAEAVDSRKFCFSEITAKIETSLSAGYSVGPVGFGSIADVCAMLLPGQPENRPMAIGFVYEPSSQIDAAALVHCLQSAVENCLEQPATQTAVIQPISSAA